jgi:ribosome maturation factor RimP
VVDTDLSGPFTSLLASAGLELYDLEVTHSAVRVTVTRPGGIDLDELERANAALSRWLDDHDPMPGRYTLEVSSPGLERRLRTPSHFAGAVGETVTLRITDPDAPAERVTGTLVTAGDESLTLATDDGPRTASYDRIERARTVFSWGGAPKPTGAARRGSVAGREK